jgi:protoporphyrinogen IX oxidase
MAYVRKRRRDTWTSLLRPYARPMEPALASVYLWLKAAHIIAVIAWMAGLFYLPRLFVYHATAEMGSPLSNVFKMMERRLYVIILWPAMIASWLTGAALIWVSWDSGIKDSGWALVKLGAVLLMSILHLRLGQHMRQFQADRNRQSSRYFRLMNEVPTILMIVIVLMAVTKPF